MFAPLPLPPELDAQLQAHFERTREHFEKSDLRAKPEAIILGGGYGRGEGGITKDSEGRLAFFNDLDYFIFTAAPEDPALLAAVESWEQEESQALGIDVEAKCLPRRDLADTPGSMMFYDLVAAHTVVDGPKDYLDRYKSMARPGTIRPVEATRLLWNRGSGLLFAREGLEFEGDLDIVHRNQAKAKLALGDALLTIRGDYRAYVRERQERLQAHTDIDPRIAALHAEGVAFKLKPTAMPGRQVLLDTQEELTALWLRCFLEVESARLQQSFQSAHAYAHYRGRIFPETGVLRNLMLYLRDRIKRSGGLRPPYDYPRGALQRALVLLLEERPQFAEVSRFLGEQIDRLDAAVLIYTKWWQYYS